MAFGTAVGKCAELLVSFEMAGHVPFVQCFEAAVGERAAEELGIRVLDWFWNSFCFSV